MWLLEVSRGRYWYSAGVSVSRDLRFLSVSLATRKSYWLDVIINYSNIALRWDCAKVCTFVLSKWFLIEPMLLAVCCICIYSHFGTVSAFERLFCHWFSRSRNGSLKTYFINRKCILTCFHSLCMLFINYSSHSTHVGGERWKAREFEFGSLDW